MILCMNSLLFLGRKISSSTTVGHPQKYWRCQDCASWIPLIYSPIATWTGNVGCTVDSWKMGESNEGNIVLQRKNQGTILCISPWFGREFTQPSRMLGVQVDLMLPDYLTRSDKKWHLGVFNNLLITNHEFYCVPRLSLCTGDGDERNARSS